MQRLSEKECSQMKHLIYRAEKYGENYSATYKYTMPGTNKFKFIYVRAEVIFRNYNVPIGLKGTVQDITKQKLFELKLKENEERLSLTIDGAKLGTWDMNIKTGDFTVNNRWSKMIGYDANEVITNNTWWKKLIHPEDLPQVEELLEKHYQGKTNMYEAEFRVKHKKGHWIWIQDKGKVIEWDHNGNALRIVGIHIDLTERILHEQETKRINEEYEALNEELFQINEELVDARDRAEQANQLKTEFLHNMSHEIRTPLNGIMGFTRFLSQCDLSQEQRSYYSSIVVNSSKQLLRIIDDILEISTLETQQLNLHAEPFNLNDFILDLFAIYDQLSKERSIPFYIKKDFRVQNHIISDRDKLHKILSNLLDNAFKFTSEGQIEMGYYVEDSKLVFYVKDTGCGISNENRDKIFERFLQVDNEISPNFGGLGLGLSIARENAKLLDGDISLKSEKGLGSTFYVTIPYKIALVVNKSNHQLSNINAPLQKKPYTVLIAEDEEVNYLYLETIIKEIEIFDINIIHVINGKEAVDLCMNNSDIDLVLMDIKMPVMNGYEATKKIKAAIPQLPVIAQTAYSTENDKKVAFKYGCDDYISKPIDKCQLINLIEKNIQTKQA